MRVRVVLLRRNGRFVKQTRPMSRYAAKLQAKAWDRKYDHTFQIEIRPENQEKS